MSVVTVGSLTFAFVYPKLALRRTTLIRETTDRSTWEAGLRCPGSENMLGLVVVTSGQLADISKSKWGREAAKELVLEHDMIGNSFKAALNRRCSHSLLS